MKKLSTSQYQKVIARILLVAILMMFAAVFDTEDMRFAVPVAKAAAAWVQDGSNSTASGTNITVALTVTAGNLIVVSTNNSLGVTPTVSDTQSNTYTEHISVAHDRTMKIWSAVASSSGSNTVSMTVGTAQRMGLNVTEFSGVDTSSSRVDQSTGTNGSGTNASSGNITTTVSNALLYGSVNCQSTCSASLGVGYSNLEESANGRMASESKVVTGIVTDDADFTVSSGTWAAAVVAFKPAFNPIAISPSFSLRQKLVSIGGQGTSTSFRLRNAGDQFAHGRSTSTSFKDLAGFLKTLFVPVKPSYEQMHYHWRNDNGTETTATSATAGVANTMLDPATKNTTYRVRLLISNEGGTRRAYNTQSLRLEYGLLSTTCSAIAAWTDVGAASGDWDMSDSTNLTEGGNTTNIAVGTGGVADENATFIAANGGIKDTSSQTSAVFVPSDSFIELEYSVTALSAATDNGTYCFRVTNAGSTTNFTYTTYAQARVAASAPTLSFAVSDTTIGFGTLTSANVRYATGDTNGTTSETVAHNLTASTNSTSGYIIYVKGATLTNGSHSISAIGSSASASSPGNEQFGFKVAASGGFGVSDSPYDTANYAYGASASTPDNIAHSNTSSTATTYNITYIGNITATTEAGSYATDLTYTITATY